MSPSGAWRRWFRLPASPPESLRGGARREAHLHRNPRAGGVAAATGSSVLARCRAFCLLAPLLAGLAGLPSGAVAQTPTLSVSPTSIDEGAVDTFTFTGFPSNWGPPTVQVSGVGYLSNCLLLRDSSFRLPGFDACGGLMDGTRSGRWDSEGREYRLALIAIADHVAEGQNTITVQFQDSIVTSRTATVSIALNDTTRQSFVSVDVVGSASVQEGQSFTVRFSMDPWFMLPSPTTVNYYLADYHGERVVLAPSISNPTRAYGENPRSVEIPAYHYFVDVEVPTMASADLDGDSKVEIILLGGKDYATSTGSVTLTVVDANPVTNEDDNTASQVQATPPTLTLGSDAASVTEGGEVTFTVTADAAPGIDIAVNLGAAEEMGEGLNYIGREQTGTVTLPADATSATWTVTAWSDEQQRADGTVAARIKPGDGYTIGTPSTVTVPLLDDDAPAVDPALVALVRSYAAETQNGADHVTRWRRVLVAFGVETYPGVTAMTAAEAEVLAATHNSSGRWTAVVATLTELEAGRAVQSNPQPIPQTGSTAVDPALVAEVRTLAGQTQHGADHVTRWRRVLVAFGVETYPGLTAMTAAEAEANARRYNSPLWPQIAAALAALETAATASSRQDDEPEPGPEPAPEPVVSITAGAGGAEGEALSFTLTADPAPAAALPVEVTVSAQGDYGVATGARTVTLPGTGSVTLTLDTTDDATDEADGSVTLTLNTGAGYSPGNPATATVAVLDDDEPAPEPVATPQGASSVDPALVALVRSYAAETQNGADHVTRWRRVLVAFGVETYPGVTAMTAAEAEVLAATHNSSGRWTAVVATLTELEAGRAVQSDPEPGPAPAPEPVVSITGGAGGAEGEALSFTLTADPAPAAALPVEVTVSAQGDYGVATGARTVTLPGTGSVTLTLDTTDDATDEADGSVTLTLNTGAGYSPGNPATATVAVLDDDEPAPEPVATPQGASSVDPALVALVRSYAAETQNGADHVTRWRRVLVAFGVETYPGVTAMTAAEAEVLAATHNSSGRWTAVVATLTELEAGRAVQSDPEPGPAPAPEPVVSITGGAGGAEGEALSFTLTADPAPAAALPVEVTVSAQGDYGVATGARTVTLPGTGSVTLTLDTTDDATDEADGSVTLTLNTGAGYSPGNPATATVAVLDDDEPAPEPEPVTLPTLSVGDEEAREGDAMEFEVTLSAPVSHEVRVRYVTWPGHDPITRAHYNLDFQPAEGELVFPPGATTRTFLVFTLDDSIDDPGDILEVELSNPVGATLADGHATGTITNSDPLPKAWLARMGRAVAQQTLDGITARFRAARTPGFEGALAGRAFTGNREPEDPDGAAPDTVSDEGWQADVGRRLDAGWDSGLRHGPGGADAFNGHTTLTLGEVLLGSSFAYTGKTDSQGGSFASWGRGSRAHFAGREDSLHLDGALTTALFGVDYARGDWLVGLALTQSWGAGHYRDPNADAGKLDTSLTAVLPYVAWRAGPRLELWGTAGHGGGSLTLAPDTDADTGHPAKTDTDWTMAAGGLRSELLAPGNGPSLALTADALWTRTAADRADGAETRSGLAGAEADVTRLRLGLAGSWTVDLGQGARLTPTLEAGARHDGGGADTGFGLELGGGIAWHAPRWGLSLDIKGRTLIAHEQAGFTERGLSASLAFDPSPLSAFGPRLTLTQALGSPADGGLEALLNPDPLRQQDGYADNRRWRLALDYGLPLFKGRLVGSPQLAIGRSQGARDLSLGWQLTPAGRHAPDMSLQLQALRRSSEYASAPEHALTLDLRANW